MDKLPIEILKKISNRKIVSLIVIPLLVAFLVNLYLIFYFERFSPNPFYFIVNKKLSILKKIDKKVDWLVVGDSSGNQGVNPAIIKDSIGGSSYNLCTFADMGLMDGCWMLDYLIKSDLAPKNVIMVQVYDSWNRNVYPALFGQYPFSWIYRKAVEPELFIPEQYRKDVFYSHFLPIIHQADRIPDRIKTLRSFKQKLAYIDDNGYNPYTFGVNEYEINADFKYHLKYTTDREPYISPHNLIAIKYLQEISENTDINIYLANSPLHDELFADSTFNKFYTKLNEIISSHFNESGRVHYINNPPILFNKSLLQSSDHLTDEGAEIFTRHLLKEISKAKLE
ncbi:MAG: hypothetical protein KAS71_13825 [Bacteroidales bacterium]|nr:hypothetical protein [Bacteroidales bacterium]